MSALPPKADLFRDCRQRPLMTLSGHFRWRGSEILHVSDHAPAGLGIRQAAPGRAHVLAHVVDPGRRRDGTGDGRVGDDELEEELSPVGAIELRRPWGQRMAFETVEQATPPEWPVDDHRQAVAEVGGSIFAVGGLGDQRGTEIYDPALDRWSRGTAVPRPLHHAAAVGA